ncbi:LysM peptidoglycan-binding domain-containing protein [Xanthomonas translucens pv. undulosa]|uniref:LysM peptidoglycan-binding domain-containing protein n=1 Tax=Xanthomonas campestris pv. translucens TaxID=343 RepID=UPI0019D61BC7|nr:LysM peptidoglycan-binding domain-containing protein [Xanthomonas translucens]QSQ43049.1 LysM peptidoglycan-binding domain-containing protein [Xanthomonas translucens pv. translucens]QSQ49099.1 LysM peptidoglycan-binding domain-containing protein [Xanthomonas translucens pv. undulosa]WLA00038.1 LysM peptidoglycan-binding domain-containing protein [Xanthomonas translucens]
MNSGIYIIKRGDSLSKIARTFGTQPKKIAELNGLDNLDFISAGQKLRLPSTEATASVSKDLAPLNFTTESSNIQYPDPLKDGDKESKEHASQNVSRVLFQFFDVLSKPIEGLKIIVDAGGKIFTHLSDNDGQIPEIETNTPGTKISVKVEKITGGTKEVAKFSTEPGWQHVLLTSPKMLFKTEQRPHEGPKPAVKIPAVTSASTPSLSPPPVSKQTEELGKITETRSPAGHPVVQTILECPNQENLRLDRNFKYRDIIIAAGKRSSFMPQAIAAIMNAEAATITEVTYQPILGKDKKPLIDKKTSKPKMRNISKNYGEWDPKSASPASSARGMTQFLDGSWIDNALTNGTRLNDKIKEKGWLTTAKIKDKKGNEKEVPAFALADGTLVKATKGRTLARTLSSRPYLTSRATASDTNLQALLDMRFDAECAIDAAVDYGIINLKGLKDSGYDLSSLNDGERAKIVYLCHHLGLADAKRFIQKTISEESAKNLLVTQVGSTSAKEYADSAGGTYVEGHRSWLNGFENKRIILTKYMCDPSKSPEVRELTTITDSIKILS